MVLQNPPIIYTHPVYTLKCNRDEHKNISEYLLVGEKSGYRKGQFCNIFIYNLDQIIEKAGVFFLQTRKQLSHLLTAFNSANQAMTYTVQHEI
jgi:hypothetical protein